MSPDHPLAPLLRELCPKRYPGGRVDRAKLALDPIEIYKLACALGARGVALRGQDSAWPTEAEIAEGVRAAEDGWADGMEFEDAVRMGIGVAMQRHDVSVCLCASPIPGAHDVDCPVGAALRGETPTNNFEVGGSALTVPRTEK